MSKEDSQWGTRPSATTRAGSVVNKLEKLVFGRLDPLKQVMVERSREKHSLHRTSRMIVLYGLWYG